MATGSSLAAKINRFIKHVQPDMDQLVAGLKEAKLGLWVRNKRFRNVDPVVSGFLDSLKLPAAIGSPGKPNLLFHDLGLLESDSLSDSLESIFVPDGHTLLINVSGSGKTRIVLEGLSRNWGFYFVCQDDGTFIGSKDLVNALHDKVPNDPNFTKDLRTVNLDFGSEDFKGALKINRLIANVRFSEVLLARLTIFNQFLQSMEIHMQQHGQGDMSQYIQRWLHLQLYPNILHSDYNDVFSSLTEALASDSPELLEKEIKRARNSVRQKLAKHSGRRHFYIVIDEAQEASSLHSYSFISARSVEWRPVLRELVFDWTTHLNSHTQDLYTSFVVTGTGVSVQGLTEAVSSASLKHHSHTFAKSSATGAFDLREQQESYVARYVPVEILNTDSGRRLLDRMWHWLRGRYRLTASFLTCLLENCYHRPHELLNLFLKTTGNFEPLDYDSDLFPESPFPIPNQVSHIMTVDVIDFRKLQGADKSEFRKVVIKAVYEYFLKSTVTQLLGTDGNRLLQLGFARVPSFESSVKMDERLMLLACLAWTNPNKNDGCTSFYGHICDSIELHNASNPSNGFEHYLAHYFSMAFSEFTPLQNIFDFMNQHPLARRRAKLVALKSYIRPSTNEVYYEEGVTKISAQEGSRGQILGCVSSLGRAHNRRDPKGEFGRWLRFQYTEPFYFPDNSAAGDIMFVLKLDSTHDEPECYLWVAVQAKYHSGEALYPDQPHNIPEYADPRLLYLDLGVLSAAIDTTTPRRFSLYKADVDDRLHLSEEIIPRSNQKVSDKKQGSNGDGGAAERKKKRDDILSAMRGLPKRAPPEVAGTYSCLRVVASWPAITDLQRFVTHKRDWKDADREDGHPLACLNRHAFVNLTAALSPTDILMECERRRRTLAFGEVHDTSSQIIAGPSTYHGQSTQSQEEDAQSQESESGGEVDYSIEIGSQVPFESQHLYVPGTASGSRGQISDGGMEIDDNSRSITAPPTTLFPIQSSSTDIAPSQAGPSSGIQPQPVITQSRGPVVRGKTKVRASQSAKTKSKERRRTSYKFEKEKDVSGMRKGKQPAMVSTLMPTPRKSARLASKVQVKGKAKGESQGSDNMDVD
ncbi:hypothetical protein WG66_013387 [Moniliophthora roreri]|uniref:Uncharacterized protein n=1 Tax=Moniliophthora roreri TaxID=221103 RepID=A0A0W0G569_MONRR|nr:hypothetical protein WG66_013387 [Moniliophthora roreri]